MALQAVKMATQKGVEIVIKKTVGDDPPTRCKLKAGEPFKIGRQKTGGFVIQGMKGVSSLHAEIELAAKLNGKGPMCFVRDCSQNGTGVRHPGKEWKRVSDKPQTTPLYNGAEILVPLRIKAAEDADGKDLRLTLSVEVITSGMDEDDAPTEEGSATEEAEDEPAEAKKPIVSAAIAQMMSPPIPKAPPAPPAPPPGPPPAAAPTAEKVQNSGASVSKLAAAFDKMLPQIPAGQSFLGGGTSAAAPTPKASRDADAPWASKRRSRRGAGLEADKKDKNWWMKASPPSDDERRGEQGASIPPPSSEKKVDLAEQMMARCREFAQKMASQQPPAQPPAPPPDQQGSTDSKKRSRSRDRKKKSRSRKRRRSSSSSKAKKEAKPE